MTRTTIVAAPDGSATDTWRQQLLVCCSSGCDAASPIVAWAFYDGASEAVADASDDPTPPYGSVLAAMRDGWRVLAVPPMQSATDDNAYRTGILPYEWVLERLERIHA